MAIQQVIRLVARGLYQGTVQINNVWFFYTETAGAGPGLNASDLAASFVDWAWNTTRTGGRGAGQWGNRVTPAYAPTSVVLDRLYPDAADAAFLAVGTHDTHAGGLNITVLGVTAGVSAAPVNSAGIITWRTAHAGRSGRGRSYVSGLVYPPIGAGLNGIAPSDDIIGGAGTGPRAHLNGLGGAFLATWGPGGTGFGTATSWRQCLVSRQLAGTVVVVGQRPRLVAPLNLAGVFPITAYTIPNYWATMGSRRGGRGV